MLKITRTTSLVCSILLLLSACNAAQAQKLAEVSVDIPIVGINLAERLKSPKQQPSDYLTLIGYRIDIGYGPVSVTLTKNYEHVVWEPYEYYSLEEEDEALVDYDLFLFWLSELGAMRSLSGPVDDTYAVAVRLVPLFAIHGSATASPTQQMTPQMRQLRW